MRVLKTFVAVAHARSFSAAARTLNTVQPAVSRQISDLETELGVSLLWRSTRNVRITAAGELLLKEAEAMLAREEQARKDVQRAGRGEIGRLRIGFLGSACQSFLPRLIRSFTEKYPAVQVSLSEMPAAEQVQALTEGRLDVSLSRSLPHSAPASIKSTRIYTDRLRVFVSRGHPLDGEDELSLVDLANEPLVLYHRAGSSELFDQIINACRAAGYSPEIIQQPNTMQSVLTSVASGLGVAIAPGCIRKLDMVDCRSLALRTGATEIPFNLHHDGAKADAPTLAFVKMVKASCREIRATMAA